MEFLQSGGPQSPVELPRPCYATFIICPLSVLHGGPTEQKRLHQVRDKVESGEMREGKGKEIGLRLAFSSFPVLYHLTQPLSPAS